MEDLNGNKENDCSLALNVGKGTGGNEGEAVISLEPFPKGGGERLRVLEEVDQNRLPLQPVPNVRKI